jgi:L-iditol 2-dehydrogenase
LRKPFLALRKTAMDALVLKEPMRFAFEEVKAPAPKADEVLIAVRACGICGSDVHGMDGSTRRRQPPIIMGHEASGVIVQVGDEAGPWETHERVTFDSTIYCGECSYCRRGLVNLCDRRMVLGVSCDDYRRDGAFAEYVAVPGRLVYRLPKSVSFEQAAMVEPLSVAVHAVGRTPIPPDDTAVVIGTGVIGLLVVQVLKALECGEVVAVDVQNERLDCALRCGADVALNAGECDAVREVGKITSGKGADLVFEAVGLASSVRTALSCIRKGGAAVLIGNLSPRVELPLQDVVTRQLSLFGSCASCGEYARCLDLIADGKVDVDALVSAVAPLSEGADWFERLYRKEPGLLKVILKPGE